MLSIVKKKSPVISLYLFVTLLTASAYGEIITKHDTLMGTDIEITVSVENPTEDIVSNAIRDSIKEIKRIEILMTSWNETSELSKINNNAGLKPVKVSKELIDIIKESLSFSESTGGVFDISYSGLKGLWNFYDGKKYVPSDHEIKERLNLVNYKNITIGPDTVFIKNGMRIDLGGVAKGYAVDKAAEVLRGYGIKNFLIKAGGDIRADGTKNGKPWKIGIQHPRDTSKFIGFLDARDISISTSGDYERYFIKDGKRYNHIIDPRTGYPSEKCQSVTILGPKSIITDALSTSIFILGPVEGMQLVEKSNGLEVIIIDKDGNMSLSKGLKNYGNLQ